MTDDAQIRKWLIAGAVAIGALVFLGKWMQIDRLLRRGWPRWAAALWVELDDE